MPTITLDLPEATYRDALAFDVNERVRLFAVALRTARAIEEAEEDADIPDYDRPTKPTWRLLGAGYKPPQKGERLPAMWSSPAYANRLGPVSRRNDAAHQRS